MIFEKIQKTIKHNFKKQNLPHTLLEVGAVFVWMSSIFVFYYIMSQLFAEIEIFSRDKIIAIVATYFLSDGLIYAFLYRNIHNLGKSIESGKIHQYILLPVNFIKYLSNRNVQFASMIQIPIALFLVIFIQQLTAVNVILWIISIFTGFLIAKELWLILSGLSFWIKLEDTGSILFDELTQTSLFPLKIFRSFNLFYIFLPFTYIAAGGSKVLTEGNPQYIIGQGIVLVCCCLLRRILWKLGIRKSRF
jgi:ABC-type uncharacterized transport system permease subunit